MANNLIKRIFAVLAMTVLSFSLYAFEKKFEQKLSWTGDENAFEYKVEIAKADKKSSDANTDDDIDKTENETEEETYSVIKSTTTTDNFIVVNLAAGMYKYRVTAYDFLQRESSVTEWRSFEVIKALEPELELAQKEVEVKKHEKKAIEIPVDMKQITNESKVEFVNEETGEIIEGKVLETETEDGLKVVEFPKVADGDYKIKVTNPSGLSTVSDEAVTVKTKVKEKKVINWPIDLSLMGGVGYKLVTRNELSEDAKDEGLRLTINGKLNYLPFDLGMFNFGFETDFDYLAFNYKTGEYGVKINLYDLTFTGIARINFLQKKMGVCVKAGGGIVIMQKGMESYSSLITASPDKTYGYFCVRGGVGVQYIPFKHLIIEAGADYTHVFIPDLKMNYINPYICVGLRI